ncbi:MAG: 3-phosphoinositide dependent protein kinase-1 [Caeruleum heppii]|nr:MAG: 3-phosphoinositide dependent protein kinase-1 [Caeruleum heppii]
MENDLSLSQSLGGLRIANPDDAEVTSSVDRSNLHSASIPPRISSVTSPLQQPSEATKYTPSATPPTPHNPSPLSSPYLQDVTSPPPDISSSTVLPSPEIVSLPASARNPRAIPMNHQAQQHQQYPLSPSQRNGNGGFPSNGPSQRPTSTLYTPGSRSAGLPAMTAGTYRSKADSSESVNNGLPRRSNSRGSASVLQAGVPSRETSHSERSYRQGQQPIPGSRPPPPRSSSRGLGQMSEAHPPRSASAMGGSSNPGEGGPLSSSEEWKERGAAMGVKRELDRNGNEVTTHVKKGVKDFNFGRTLGEGSYSTVIAATDRQTLTEYAIKVLDKRHIIKEKKVKYVNIEKDTLNRVGQHPGVVRLYFTFQDERSLYFVLDIASNGELLGVLKRMGTFDEDCTRYYGAQILDTIDYMHSRGVIHRDLKPENVLLDHAMHVKITDFGTAKILDPPRPRAQDQANDGGIPLAGDPLDGSETDRAISFVGTAEYVSPELLKDKNACKASDLWAFGCIIYQLLAGRPPFKAGNEYQTFQKIVNLDYEFPRGFPAIARDLVERLLVLDPAKRLPIEHIKNHQFFDGIQWGRGLWMQKAPRLRAYVPPQQEPNVIKLNGHPVNPSQSNTPRPHPSLPNSHGSTGPSRPSPRLITDIPPPSQLDIEWSPVLTRTNERILKLGNLVVYSAPVSQSPNSKTGSKGEASAAETPRKLSRFFGGNTTKKRQRLVMITSSGRVIMAAAGGDEKKTKTEIPLLARGCECKSVRDAKGVLTWSIHTNEKLYTFEDPKSSPKDPELANTSTQEWLKTIDRAKEMGLSQSLSNSYYNNMNDNGEDAFRDMSPPLSTNSSSLGGEIGMNLDGMVGPGGGRLSKGQQTPVEETPKGRKRFSKRQSKSGLTAVF